MEPRRFAYVANPTPIFQGGIAATMLIALAFAWGWATGRVQQVDAWYLATVVVCVTAVPMFVMWSHLRHYRRSAALCGHVEVDGVGLRSRLPDGTLSLEAAWSDFSRAIVDEKNCQVVLTRPEGAAVLLGAVTEHGNPAGAVVLERFTELVEFVQTRVPTAPHEGTRDPAAALRSLGLGAAGLLLATALYGVNVALAAKLHWSRWLAPMPLAIAALSLLTVLAGVRLGLGGGPMVSPLYGRQHGVALLRFFAVAVLANFVLLGVANAL